MFTSNQGDLSVHYYDPESGRIRQYYPDFLAKMTDGSYQLIEVKGDNKIDDTVVKTKKAAAEEMAVASGVKYLMYASSQVMPHSYFRRGCSNYAKYALLISKGLSILTEHSIFPPMSFSFVSGSRQTAFYCKYLCFVHCVRQVKSDAKGHPKS